MCICEARWVLVSGAGVRDRGSGLWFRVPRVDPEGNPCRTTNEHGLQDKPWHTEGVRRD